MCDRLLLISTVQAESPGQHVYPCSEKHHCQAQATTAVAVRRNTVSQPAHLSGFAFTAAESGRSARQHSDKCTALLQHNRGESRCPTSKQAGALEASGAIPCVDFLVCQNLTAVNGSIQFQQQSSSLATAAVCSRSYKSLLPSQAWLSHRQSLESQQTFVSSATTCRGSHSIVQCL